jgi:hypothetical protein
MDTPDDHPLRGVITAVDIPPSYRVGINAHPTPAQLSDVR